MTAGPSARTPTAARALATTPAVAWLLEGDPAIRWQTLRDLVGAPDPDVQQEREKVAREGWGAALLAKQDPDGTWGGGLYLPKWTSTTYTMLLLRDLGLSPSNPQARRACARLFDFGLRPDGGINYGRARRSETCITGMVLSILSYFGYGHPHLDAIANHLLGEQMPDGGWNCQRCNGATHSSVHSTISVLEGLSFYESRCRSPRVRAARRRGHEFLLMHSLFRSDRTGQIIDPAFLRFSFPPRWRYDILRALDHFQAVNAPRDKRLGEAIGVVHERQQDDGRWTLENNHRGPAHFAMERVGAPSRWNTLRALRVLRWWNRASPLAR